MFFSRKKKIAHKTFDPSVRKPAIRVSICTGEKVAGFQNLRTKNFEEVMLIRDEDDLSEFRETYGIEGDIENIY